MKYDFTSLIDHHGHDAVAVDGLGAWPGVSQDKPKEGFDLIPMWVADMNFATAPSVTEALAERIKHPIFSYYLTASEYYDSIIRWQKVRNGVERLTADCIGYENGVLGGMVAALEVLGIKEIIGNVRAKGNEVADEPVRKSSNKVLNTSLITMASGADNIGVYIPLFAGFLPWQIALAVCVFLGLIAVWCVLGKALADLSVLRSFLTRYKTVVVPAVYLGVGGRKSADPFAHADRTGLWRCEDRLCDERAVQAVVYGKLFRDFRNLPRHDPQHAE